MMRMQKMTTAWVATGALGVSVMAGTTYAFADQARPALPTGQSVAGSVVAGEQVGSAAGPHRAAPKAFTAPSTATANTPSSPRTANTAKSPASPRTAVSAKSPVSPRTPVSAKSPASPKSPVSAKSPVSPRTPVSAKSPASPKSPVSAKSPVSPRTPNSPNSAPSAR